MRRKPILVLSFILFLCTSSVMFLYFLYSWWTGAIVDDEQLKIGETLFVVTVYLLLVVVGLLLMDEIQTENTFDELKYSYLTEIEQTLKNKNLEESLFLLEKIKMDLER
ncbi:hypothetical protein WMC59_12590 [Staphylococcus delphini]|uniref:hypothetical protein n=1 Tax=Staphylococcus delphini TaxID=53344 RepID=UPI00374F9FE4